MASSSLFLDELLIAVYFLKQSDAVGKHQTEAGNVEYVHAWVVECVHSSLLVSAIDKLQLGSP